MTLDTRLSGWRCNVWMVWVQIPSRNTKNNCQLKKCNSNSVGLHFETYISLIHNNTYHRVLKYTVCVRPIVYISNLIRGINKLSNCVRSNEWMMKYILISSRSLNDIYLWCVSEVLLLGMSYVRYFPVVCK